MKEPSSSIPLWTLMPACQCWLTPVRLGLTHVTDDALYLSDLSSVVVGSQICQTQPIGRLEEVFAAFHDQWKQRWCRHDHVPFDSWDQLIAFARAHLPQGIAPETCITPDLLRAEAASKKPRAATGLRWCQPRRSPSGRCQCVCKAFATSTAGQGRMVCGLNRL